MLKRLTLAVVLVLSTTARADEGTLLLEQLVKQDQIEKRLVVFFERHKVKRPIFYAKLISGSKLPLHKKKVMAAILVPETRGACVRNRWSGATGPWQVMPFWKKQLNIKGNLLDPVTNFHAATRVYDIHEKESKFNEHRTLVAYSGNTPGYADKVQALVRQI